MPGDAPAGHVYLRAFQTELDPTVAERRLLGRHVAAARVSHNWALERWNSLQCPRAIVRGLRALAGLDVKGGEAANMLGVFLRALVFGTPVAVRTPKGAARRYRYKPPEPPDVDVSPNGPSIHASLVREKNNAQDLAWLGEVSAFAVREAVEDVADGWKHFFEHLKAGRFDKAGPPQFRKARDRHYHVDQPDPIRVTDRAVKIPGVGWVRLKERGYLPPTRADSHALVGGGKCVGLGISERDGRWYVSLRAHVPRPMPQKRAPGRAKRDAPVPRNPNLTLGVEVGVRSLVTLSTGAHFAGLREDERIIAATRRLHLWQRRQERRWQRGKSRREQSAGWREAVRWVGHYHAQLTDLRADLTGKAVRAIVDTGAAVIVMREPATAKMLARRHASEPRTRNALAPAVHAARMGDVLRRVGYKQKWAGGQLVEVPVAEPVTRRCNKCGAVRDTEPAYPDFHCTACGHREERDDNAAANLKDYPGRNPGADPGRSGPDSPSAHTEGVTAGGTAGTASGESPGHGSGRKARERASLGPGNRPRAGARLTAQADQPLTSPRYDGALREHRGDAPEQSQGNHTPAAPVPADDGDRSQTVSQPRERTAELRGVSGAQP